jgi:predicted CopG family antitoxin
MTRIISISDEAYEKLARIKGKDSFTQAILRLLREPKGDIMSLAGVWKDEHEMDGIFKKILEDRHKRDDREIARW